ncbi:RDD family protein [Amycolatopsis pithecellobii]|nr:RDD family protein [Amycolatopsis pithecellobii]
MSTPSPPGRGVVVRRIIQSALDGLLVMVPLVVLAAAVVIVFHPRGLLALVTFVKVVFFTMLALDFILVWWLAIWWPYRHGGQTPGMRWLRLRVVTLDGEHPSLGMFVLRSVLMVVDGFAWGLVGVVLILSTPRRQRLGDIVARTLVVRVPKSADEPALPRPDGDLGAVSRT